MKKKPKHSRVPFLSGSVLDRFEFANGLRLFVLERKVAPVFSFQTWFNVGSRDEVEGKSGLAHLFEHMMFKGTKKMAQGEFDRAMESAGARDLNAFTSMDYTAYVASLPVEFLELVARLESDRMVGLSLTKEQFESEREVVHNERKQRLENNPEGLMYEELQKLSFRSHPYGRPIIGFAEDLDSMTTADCDEFYRTHYSPNNAVICVVGGVKPERVARIIEKHYGAIPPASKSNSSVRPEEEQREERVSILNLPVQVEKAYMGFKIPPAKDEIHAPLAVLSAILSSGRSSRLYRAFVDTGLTMDISVHTGGSKDPGLAYVSFSCQAGRRAEEGVESFDRSVKDLIESEISSDEMERAKNKLRTEILLGMATNSSVAHFIGQNELVMGDVAEAVREIEQISRVTADQVKSAAKRIFRRESRSIVIGKPA